MLSEITSDFERMGSLPRERKFILIFLIIVLFGISIVVGAYLSRGAQKSSSPTAQTPSTTTGPTTSLTLSSDAPIGVVGKPQKVTVTLGETGVTAADVVVVYDPAAVSVSALENGEVFDRVIRRTTADGVVVFSAAVSPEKKDTLTQGVVMSFMITPQVAGTTTLSFDRDKTITAVNGSNTLGTTNELSISSQ